MNGLSRFVLLSCVVLGTLGAAPPPHEDPASTPPGRVGRLSIIEGPVSFQPAGADDWATAEPNRPVTEGDRLWADADGRGEVDIGSTALRLSSETEVDIVQLDDDRIQVSLPQGSLIETVGDLDDDQDYEIDTPNAAISIVDEGSYRVDVSPDGGTTTITVRSGRVEVTAAGASFPLEANQVSSIRGDNPPTYDLNDAGPPDEFDRWSQARDDRARRGAEAPRYVSENMPGAGDLDAYGTWEQDPAYGPMWYPTRVEAGWAPYRTGRWVWVGPWGWTWVDTAPWGFAPYHYGRWAYVHNRWGWCPGRVAAWPVYAPALVAFVGGSGWSVSVSFGPGGGLGWFPLAPEEVYYPSYPHDVAYTRRINVTSVTNVTHITYVTNVTNVHYRNRGVSDAVTAVPRGAFERGQPVARAAVRVESRQLESARVIGAGAPVAPTRESFALARAKARPPEGLATRPVVATHAPPPPAVPFAAQEKALKANPGRPLPRSQTQKLAPSHPAERAAAPPIRSAVAPPPDARPLTPARPGLPAVARPADPGAVRRPPPRPAPPAPAPAAPAAERSPEGASPKGSRRPAPSPLDRSYQAERAQVEARHRQEFARPPQGETPSALAQRQDAEHRALQERYRQGQSKGMTTLPPAQKPGQQPPPKPAPKPTPKPKGHQ